MRSSINVPALFGPQYSSWYKRAFCLDILYIVTCRRCIHDSEWETREKTCTWSCVDLVSFLYWWTYHIVLCWRRWIFPRCCVLLYPPFISYGAQCAKVSSLKFCYTNFNRIIHTQALIDWITFISDHRSARIALRSRSAIEKFPLQLLKQETNFNFGKCLVWKSFYETIQNLTGFLCKFTCSSGSSDNLRISTLSVYYMELQHF